jgi:hypothetical protein
MGNTNIPQFGAIGTRNSRDTLVGDDQLTEEQKQERDKAQKHGVGPAPGRPSNAPERIPGQNLDPNDGDDVADGKKHDCDPDAEQRAKDGSRKSANTAVRSEREALGGHVDTGHSPSDAT